MLCLRPRKRCEGVNECEYMRHVSVQYNNCLRLLERLDCISSVLSYEALLLKCKVIE